MAINLHAELFSSAAYLCLQQESMSVSALSRLLEAGVKSIKHATAMSAILAIELFQARRNAAIATSKLLLDNSSHELRNALINSRQLFDNKIKKSNYEAQQLKYLASCSTNVNTQQQQKPSYSATGLFKKPSRPNLTDLNRTNCTGLKRIHSLLRPVQGRTFPRGVVVTQSSSPPLTCLIFHKVLKANPFHCLSYHVRIFQWEEDWPFFVEQWGELTQNKWVLSIVRDGFRIPFNSTPPISTVPISVSQSSSPLL